MLNGWKMLIGPIDVEVSDPPIPRTTETHRSIGNEGGILYLDSCDVTMAILPGSLEAGSCHDVSLALITEDPPTIKEDEFLTGHGVEIDIPRLLLYSGNQPITITLPHAASPMKANKEFADIIWKHTESTSSHRVKTSNKNTRCIIKEREMDIIISANSVINGRIQLWVPFDIHRHATGKLMACTPFLPVDMVQGNDVTLRMYIHEDIPYIAEKIKEEEEQLLNRQVHPKRCFELAPESSDLQIECNGGNMSISAKELFNQRETLVSMPITTEPNTRTQMINISMSTKDKDPTTSMAFMAIRTDFSTDMQSTLDEIITASDTESREKDTGIEDVITKDMNTDKYYHLGIALGLSYETLDSIQASIRGQKVEAGVYTSNQRAAIIMIRYWKHLQHPDSQADDHLTEVWTSVTNSRKPDVPVKQASSLDETVGSTTEENFEDKSCGARPVRTESFYDIGTKASKIFVGVKNRFIKVKYL
ncbi:uncharacterized protein LOC121430162 [Lytechinus variegatus]|uniref:uncharacterized protein LOC121430162 n=1 Tax=Lytechinus variegatus TaxID=7654 RepID=UPI001BB24808|nr:uncharacterized protein LOC121430162 [Lytechinus variegatus]